MSEAGWVLRVVDWDGRYETKGSLKKAGPLEMVSVRTDLTGIQIQRLLGQPGGLHAYGIWSILLLVAARCSRRGVLAERGVPMSVLELARAVRCTTMEIEQAIKLLRGPGVELLERVPLVEALKLPELPESAPRRPRRMYSVPFTHCPNCQTDLVAAAEQVLSRESGCGCHSPHCHPASQASQTHHTQPAPSTAQPVSAVKNTVAPAKVAGVLGHPQSVAAAHRPLGTAAANMAAVGVSPGPRVTQPQPAATGPGPQRMAGTQAATSGHIRNDERVLPKR